MVQLAIPGFVLEVTPYLHLLHIPCEINELMQSCKEKSFMLISTLEKKLLLMSTQI